MVCLRATNLAATCSAMPTSSFMMSPLRFDSRSPDEPTGPALLGRPDDKLRDIRTPRVAGAYAGYIACERMACRVAGADAACLNARNRGNTMTTPLPGGVDCDLHPAVPHLTS